MLCTRFSLRSKIGRGEMLSMVPLKCPVFGHTNPAGAKFCNDYAGVPEGATECRIEVERRSSGDTGSPRKRASYIDTAEPRALSGDAALRTYPTAAASPTIGTRASRPASPAIGACTPALTASELCNATTKGRE